MPETISQDAGTMIACPKCGCQMSLSATPMDQPTEEPTMPSSEPMEDQAMSEPDGDEYDKKVMDYQAGPGRRKFQNPGAVASALRSVGKRSM